MTEFEDGPFLEKDFEVEVSALDAGRDGDSSSIVQELLSLLQRARSKRVALVGCALLSALLILGSVPPLRNQALHLFGGADSPTPGPLVYTRLQIVLSQPGQGWSLAGPPGASSIVFAPSAPATVYTCGVQSPSGGQPVPLIFGVSADAGNIWQILRAPATGGSCALTVDPTNALDVLLVASPGDHCASPQASKLYRTFDGGKHWSAWSLPPPGPTQSAALLCYQWAWVGSTLFIAPFLAGDYVYIRLAASVAGKAFVWLKQQALFTGVPSSASINRLFATNSTLYVELFSQSCLPTCVWYRQSRDNGATWARFEPTALGQPISLVGAGADGRTLLGQIVQGNNESVHIYLRSADAGATWEPLPPALEGLIAGLMTATPDGTVYAAFDQNLSNALPATPPGIYKAAPGAAAWSYAAPLPGENWFLVAWDESGHPAALWGSGAPLSGIERHQP